MAQLIALEWDEQEIRIAAASSRGKRCVVEHACAIPIEPGDHSEEAIGRRIGAALAARRIDRPDAIVVVGRANIELQRMTLPPAPDEELPDMVRFEAAQRFTTLGEDWPIDFFPVDENPTEERDVIAAGINPALVQQILATCEAAEVRPRRLVLRPCGAASLLIASDHGPASKGVRLLVDPLVHEADLTVVVDHRVVFMRTVRLPSESGSPLQTNALVSEVRRTMAAAQNQLSGQRVEQVIVCGSDNDHTELRRQLSDIFDMAVESFDPFDQVETPRYDANCRTGDPGRLTPLLGVLRDETAGSPHAIDFLNPRQRPEPVNQWRTAALAITACVVALLFGSYFIYSSVSALNMQRKSLQGQLDKLNKEVKPAKIKAERAQKVQQWEQYDAFWLEELCELSRDFPQPEEIILTRLKVEPATPPRRVRGPRRPKDKVVPDGGHISLDLYMFDQEVMKAFGARLTDSYHIPETANPTQEERDGKTVWRISETITIKQKPDSPGRPPKRPSSSEKGGAK